MKNLFDDIRAKGLDDLDMRVYTSRLLGSDQDLVLHGGGNTSVKIDDILYVKGSGWDLGSIEKEGFSPARMSDLLSLLKYEKLSDTDMVRYQKEALIDKNAPNPSVEAILHALIPYKFVDHTHADAIVTISNTVNGEQLIEEIYGENYLIIPYVMPGFILAKVIDEMTQGVEWESLEGIILHNHGVFTFDNDAKESYDKMIATVAKAEEYLGENAPLSISESREETPYDIERLQELLSKSKGYDVVLRLNQSSLAQHFASQGDEGLYQKGVLTPEHIIRTKRLPILFGGDYRADLASYMESYREYFDHYSRDEIMLNTTPNWAVIQGVGTLSIGKNEKEAMIIEDITSHTMRAILQGEELGGYQSISESDSFEMEYWELEQMKLKGK
ncbi:MAG: class II aldolase/adducin family protein [Campylobacterota bacterium]|nr:class II aldolase/adducin family protein [Campylobacterota bacterium]